MQFLIRLFNKEHSQHYLCGCYLQRKKNEQREEKYQQVIDRNQQVIEEQAKAFGSISKDVTEIKQKLFEGDVQ